MTMKAGTVLNGPDGMGYTVTRDLNAGDAITVDCLEPFGGAPDPKQSKGMRMPVWLANYFMVRKQHHG